MKTPVVIGVVVALHCVAIGTLLMTQGCGSPRGGDGPVQFEDKPAVLPKPPTSDVMPEKVAKPAKMSVKAVEPEAIEKPLPPPKKDVVKPVKPAAPAYKSYTVKSGDSVGYIAQRFKITAAEIKELNPSIKDISKIREGQTLKLPSYVDLNAPAPKKASKPKPVVAKESKSAEPSAGASAPAPSLGSAGEYVIVAGDYPEKIAKKLGVKQDDLMKANKITDPKKLKIGQKLVVPGAAPVAPPPLPMAPVEPAPIAPLPDMGAPTSGIPAAPVTPAVPGVIEPAGELQPLAPAPAAPAAPAPGAPMLAPAAPAVPGAVKPPSAMQTHLVAPGETLKDIAMLYTVTVQDIMKANGMTAEAVAPGQKLTIPPAQ